MGERQNRALRRARAITEPRGRVTPHSGEPLVTPNVTRNSETNAELNKRKKSYMLYTIALVLIILWLLGLVSGYALGGFIHILLMIAVIMILVNLIGGRRAA